MGRAAANVSQRARLDTPHQFDKRRRGADLETYVQADLGGVPANFQDPLGAGYVHRHGLFAIDVFAPGDHGRQVLGMVVGRGGDHDGVHFSRFGKLAIGVRTHESPPHARVAFRFGQLVEAQLGFLDGVRK